MSHVFDVWQASRRLSTRLAGPVFKCRLRPRLGSESGEVVRVLQPTRPSFSETRLLVSLGFHKLLIYMNFIFGI